MFCAGDWNIDVPKHRVTRQIAEAIHWTIHKCDGHRTLPKEFIITFSSNAEVCAIWIEKVADHHQLLASHKLDVHGISRKNRPVSTHSQKKEQFMYFKKLSEAVNNAACNATNFLSHEREIIAFICMMDKRKEYR